MYILEIHINFILYIYIFYRTQICSRAINQSLKELIEQFVVQKEKIEKGNANANSLFTSKVC